MGDFKAGSKEKEGGVFRRSKSGFWKKSCFSAGTHEGREKRRAGFIRKPSPECQLLLFFLRGLLFLRCH
jgi:hypothetical protein